MTTRLFILLAIASTGLFAQTQAERIKAAEAELVQLAKQVTELPLQPAPARSAPIRPNPAAARVARKIAEFAALNEDLALIRRAQLLLAEAQQKAGDPVGAITLRDALCAETLDDGGATALLQASKARLTWGDPVGALKGFNRLEAEAGRTIPRPPAELVSKAQKAAALFEDQLQSITNGIRRGGKGSAAGWVAARRFIGTWPIAPQCQQLIDAILKKLNRAGFAAREGYLRQVALFFPKHKEWSNWSLKIVQNDRKEGDYDSAITLGLRLLSRSESVTPSAVDTLRDTVAAAEKLNAQIAARKLSLRPLTCANRYNDIMTQIQTATAVEDILTLEEEFVADYPDSSKVSALQLAVATASAEQFPEEAIARLKKIASRSAESREGQQAALTAIPLIAEQEGEEAAEEFIEKRLQGTSRPADQAALILQHSRLLESADRPEEALTMLEKRAEALGPAVARRLTRAIARLKKSP